MTADIGEEPASPPCFAAHAEGSYMGYAGQESVTCEIRAFGAALERASALAPGRSALRAKLEELEKAVAGLAGSCGVKGGALPEGQTAAEVLEQAVKRLQAFLPRIGDDTLHRQLRALLGEGRDVLALFAPPDGPGKEP